MASTMTIPPLPDNIPGQIAYLKQERLRVVQPLVLEGRRAGRVPDPTQEPQKSLLARLDALFTRLENDIRMTGEIKQETQIDQALQLIFMPQRAPHFSDERMERARKLSESWEGLSAAPRRPAPAVQDDNDQPEDRPARRRRISAGPEDGASSYVMPVPVDHSIWGRSGIMHGLALKKTGTRKSTVLNPQYEKERRDPKVFGHNGIRVGTWFPNRLSAIFHGAHGASQAGIVYHPDSGAYSIVVSGAYDQLDRDRGIRLFYSGSGSHENTDPARPAESTPGTKALDRSLQTGKPVRVLRTSEGGSVWHPTSGIRYDGLYQVVDKHYPTNTKRGMYEQFELVRCAEDDLQCSLEACKNRPTGQEIRDLERSKNGYASRR